MMLFALTPTSLQEQCNTNQDFKQLVENILDCIKYLTPAINQNKAVLIFDSKIEQLNLKVNESFAKSLGNLDEVILKRWYFFTRNITKTASSEILGHVIVTSEEGAKEFHDKISENIIDDSLIWLSFGMNSWTESEQYQISGNVTASIRNAHNKNNLKNKLPIYISSPKHRKLPYYKKGVLVSPMTYSPEDAQALLLVSVVIGNDRWAKDTAKNTYIRFVKTHPDREVFHGFEVSRNDIQQDILELIT